MKIKEKNSKVARKENDDQILLKMGFWNLTKGKFDDLKSFKNQKLENYLKTGLGNYFSNKRERMWGNRKKKEKKRI